MHMRIALATVVGSIVAFSLFGIGPEQVGNAATMQGRKPASGEIATLTRLPSLGSNAEAHGVNGAGTVVVGHSFDRSGLLYAVTWTLQNGSWVIAKLPYAGKAALAYSVDDAGDAVGYAGSSPRRAALWRAADGYLALGCASEEGEALAISADGLVVVGHRTGLASVWALASSCTEDLPPLVPGVGAVARAVNGDGSIIGGYAASVLVFHSLAGTLDPPGGSPPESSNSTPDPATFSAPIRQATSPVRSPSPVRWRTAVAEPSSGMRRVGSTELGTLGGEHSSSRDINNQQEVVGMSTNSRGLSTAYFWSESTGMFPLAGNKQAFANGLSDVRADDTRLVDGHGRPGERSRLG